MNWRILFFSFNPLGTLLTTKVMKVRNINIITIGRKYALKTKMLTNKTTGKIRERNLNKYKLM